MKVERADPSRQPFEGLLERLASARIIEESA